MKVEIKLYLEAGLAGQVQEAVAQFRGAGRRVSRNTILEQLIRDGLRLWRREIEQSDRVEAGLAQLIERSARHDRLLRSILLTLAEGDRAAYREVMDTIEAEEQADA